MYILTVNYLTVTITVNVNHNPTHIVTTVGCRVISLLLVVFHDHGFCTKYFTLPKNTGVHHSVLPTGVWIFLRQCKLSDISVIRSPYLSPIQQHDCFVHWDLTADGVSMQRLTRSCQPRWDFFIQRALTGDVTARMAEWHTTDTVLVCYRCIHRPIAKMALCRLKLFEQMYD